MPTRVIDKPRRRDGRSGPQRHRRSRIVHDCWSPRFSVLRSLKAVLQPAALVLLVAVQPQPALADDHQDASGAEFFENRIRPVLVKHCYKCHSSETGSAKGGLQLDTRAGTRMGGESGPAVVPGKVDESLLIDAIRYEGFEMPPNGQLPEDLIADFETWVKRGAPDPRSGSPAPVKPAGDRSGGWALSPLQRWPAPTVANPDWPASAIDRFVMARMTAAGLQPVRDADRRSLLRRVYFDLIGLPPTPEQVDQFVSDPAPISRALERVVDPLLDSPHFGERWGRHWLDVARYAESTGKEWNWAHPHAWRYRDYVIASFNEDKPYDQFVREQIAGDLLPADDANQRDEQLIASGFLAIGPKAVSIGNNEEFGLELADEQINTVCRAILGLTVGCARCHDHKFDPVPTEDYYALAGIFLSTQTLFGTSASGFKGRNNKQGTPLLPLGPDAEQRHLTFTSYEQQLSELTTELTNRQDELKKLSEGESVGGGEPRDQQLAELQESMTSCEQKLERLQSNPPDDVKYAMGVRDRDEPQDCQIRLGGEFDQLGQSVPRGFLSAIGVTDDSKISPDQSGRLELARWLTHPDNPLTARVIVNRVWRHLFARGLVSTVDNFGDLGQPPSHPLLLDHLAASFIDDDWSVKRLIRGLVLSRTYRLGTFDDPGQTAIDPDNIWYWRTRPRRLQAEELRDAILLTSGRLNRDPLHASPAVARLDPGWVGNEVKESAFKDYTHHHRSIYLPIVRDQIPGMLQTFDYPDPAEVTGAREVSVVPAQALFLLNSDFVISSARAAADRLLESEQQSTAERLGHVYRTVLGRPPSSGELQRDREMISGVDRTLQEAGYDSLAAGRDAWAALFQSLYCSGEFLFLF
jgi:hypothetical protein